MKKFFLSLIALSLLLTSGCSIKRYGLDEPSLLLQYYQGPFTWNNIVLGQTSEEELISILQKMPEVQEGSVSELDNRDEDIKTIYAGFIEGYREYSLFAYLLDDSVQVLNFRGAYLTLETAQDELGPIEKFNVVRFYNLFDEISGYGYSETDGYFLEFDYGNVWNADRLKAALISPYKITQIILASEIGLDILIETYIDYNARDYLQTKSDFSEWHGYGKYEIEDVDQFRSRPSSLSPINPSYSSTVTGEIMMVFDSLL